MFQIGDIVELYNGEEDEVYTGMISSNIMASIWHDTSLYDIITVRWFDDGTVNDYREEDLKLVQRA